MNNLLTPPAKTTDAQARANRALAMPRSVFTRLLQSWAQGVDLVWSAAKPADVITAMGASAGEAFTRSAQLRAFLEAQSPGCTNLPQAARIKAYTVNGDGTVTLG